MANASQIQEHMEVVGSDGQHVGTVDKVVEKLTSPKRIKGHEAKASQEEPQYLVRSDKTGAQAAHKPEELERGR